MKSSAQTGLTAMRDSYASSLYMRCNPIRPTEYLDATLAYVWINISAYHNLN